MNLAEIKNNVEKEICKLIQEKSLITIDELINEDYMNEYGSDELEKKTKLFYSVALKSPSNNVLGGIYVNDFTFDVNLHLETKEQKTITDLLLFLTNDREIVNRFKDENGKMKMNIKNTVLLENEFFTHLNETFKKEVIGFDFIYEEE